MDAITGHQGHFADGNKETLFTACVNTINRMVRATDENDATRQIDDIPVSSTKDKIQEEEEAHNNAEKIDSDVVFNDSPSEGNTANPLGVILSMFTCGDSGEYGETLRPAYHSASL